MRRLRGARGRNGMWGALFACGLCVILSACPSKETASPKKSSPPVLVKLAKVAVKNAPEFLTGLGTVKAFRSVDVKARVTGQLRKVDFPSDKRVKRGQLLFSIDPEPFKAELGKAEAGLEAAKAKLRHAEVDFKRYSELLKEEMITRDKFEAFEVRLESRKAAVAEHEAQLRLARLNLEYCKIHSPVDGRLGVSQVDEGNVVNAYRDTLVNVMQIKPIKVDFSLPGKYLEKIRKAASEADPQLHAQIRGETQPEIGRLTVINNSINLKTGMIRLEGVFPNGSQRLWPGQFVTVRLKLGEINNAKLVPEEALNTGPEGKMYVWRVKKDRTVEMRTVERGMRVGTMFAVTGLKKGEEVVTQGFVALRPGARVVTEAEMEKTQSGKSSAHNEK